MKKILSLLTLLVAIVTGAQAEKTYYTPTESDEIIILNEQYDATKTTSGFSNHDALVWYSASANWADKKAGDPNNGGEQTSSKVSCFQTKNNGDGKRIDINITGVSKLTIYRETSNYPLYLLDNNDSNKEIANDGGNVLYKEFTLDASKEYSIRLQGNITSNKQDVNVYAIKLTKGSAAEVAPSTPTFSVDGAVTGGTTTTIVSENASKIYYAWTESATAPEKGDAAYSELSGASKDVTIPNVTGTKYLHAYGWNNYNEGSTSDVKSAEFTITADVTAPKTWDFAVAFSDETKTALETNFTYDEGNARYKSSAQIDKNVDTDLGTYAASAWSGLIVGRTSNLSAGNLRIKENGYIQINGGNGYYKIKDLKDGDVVNIRFTSANQTSDRTFTVTGATETTATAYAFYKGYSEATITKSGNGDLTLTQDNGINVWTISVNEELPALATTTEGITVGTEGVATYVTNNAIDFTGVTDLTAYIATSNNNDYVFTEAVAGIVPGGTALLIKGASASIPLVQATSTSVATLEGNILKASNGVEVTDDTFYAFSKTNKKFQKVATSVTIPSGKAYLVIESGEAPTALDIQFDGEATAVEAIAEANEADAAAPVKVIKNGKLFIGNYNVAGQQVK